VSRVRVFGINGCATAVLIDQANGNRIADADPRRDCYAMAYYKGLRAGHSAAICASAGAASMKPPDWRRHRAA
jgi:hypothetical protein